MPTRKTSSYDRQHQETDGRELRGKAASHDQYDGRRRSPRRSSDDEDAFEEGRSHHTSRQNQIRSREFYQSIGRKGGQRVSEEYGPEFYRDIGHRGGEATASSHGHEFYQDIGRKGGQ